MSLVTAVTRENITERMSLRWGLLFAELLIAKNKMVGFCGGDGILGFDLYLF